MYLYVPHIVYTHTPAYLGVFAFHTNEIYRRPTFVSTLEQEIVFCFVPSVLESDRTANWISTSYFTNSPQNWSYWIRNHFVLNAQQDTKIMMAYTVLSLLLIVSKFRTWILLCNCNKAQLNSTGLDLKVCLVILLYEWMNDRHIVNEK